MRMRFQYGKMQPIDRFTLEEDIMAAWQIVDDLNLLYDSFEKLTVDEFANWTLGLKEMQQRRMERLFETFEAMIQNEAKIKEHVDEVFDEDEPEEDYKSDDGIVYNDVWDMWEAHLGDAVAYTDTEDRARQFLETMRKVKNGEG